MRAGARRRVGLLLRALRWGAVVGAVVGGSTAVKFLAYGAVIVAVIGSRPGWQLAGAVATMLPGRELAAGIAVKIATPRAPSMALAFMILGAGIFLLQMSRLIGEQTLRDVVLGRYHRSRTEERFFLFVDIVGSTPLAERIGPTSRIEQATRELGRPFLVSGDALERLGSLEGCVLEDLGHQPLRGRAAAMRVYGVSALLR